MDKVITTTLLIIAGVISSIFVFNSFFPIVNRSTEAMTSMSDTIDDRMKSRINIVHSANEADRRTVYVWVKNVGDSRILSVKETDVFFGLESSFSRIPYVDDAGETYPRWSYTLENDSEWKTNATLKITIVFQSDPGGGTYFAKVVIPNGIMDQYYFSM